MKGSTLGKDPAVSWVFNDWQGGTMTLSRFLKGCYMDLLTAQFNNGHLSLDEIKTVLGSDFGSSWSTLQKKFKVDSNGNFYNERLEFEITKRKSYNKSRRDNLSNDGESSPHMGNGNGIEKENELEKKRKEFIDTVDLYTGFSKELRQSFKDYWLEINKSKTKFRYEKEAFFDFNRRLNTFLQNQKKSNTAQKESKTDIINERYSDTTHKVFNAIDRHHGLNQE